ncbi:MAG: DUF5691 domain-containing protein [Candidatus Competibacter sp.]|nr:DUF5691 domain-containing protein [Candidatus Competibacter sp.]MDG4584279.1 DUF5691 domain-containing protein [Candidatus Competibacter sp.]
MAWRELVTCALLGTERQAPSISGGEGALGRILGRLDEDDREGALLRAAGGMALWRRAGWQLATDRQPLSPPCESDAAPDCGPLARQHLTLLLQGHDPELLPEWLAALGAVGRRVPEECLPALLDAGAKQTALRPALLPVLGRRGRWLARHNPAWSYAVETTDETIWQTGHFEERLALLRQLRATRPDHGRELLAATWSEELVRHRREFIQTLITGLNPSDEPLLETVLDDRNGEVARAAADLLARLPQSRLSRELTARALRLLRFRPAGLLKRDRLEADLPEGEPALRRDGITDPPSFAKLGEKAWRLSQIVAATPPATWCREWRRTPAEILAASRDGEWRQALLDGWVLATHRHRDADWAEALLPLHPDHATLTAALADILPPARFEAYLLALLRESSGGGRASALVVLSHVERPWSVELGQAVLEQVRQRIRQDKQPDWWLASALRGFARWLPPEFSEEAAAGWPTESKQWPQWENAVNEFLDRLRLRRVMRDAMAESE